MKQVVIEGPNGPRIAGTRITIYDVLHYIRLGWHHSSTAGLLGLSSTAVLAVVQYIEQHKEQVEAVYQKIQKRHTRGNSPEVQAKLDALHAKYEPIWAERQRTLNSETNGEGNPSGREHPGALGHDLESPGK